MSLLFMEGFEQYPTTLEEYLFSEPFTKWDYGTTAGTRIKGNQTGRYEGRSLYMDTTNSSANNNYATATVYRNLRANEVENNANTVIVGMAIKHDYVNFDNGYSRIFSLSDGYAQQISVFLDNNRKLSVGRGSNETLPIQVSAQEMYSGLWYYIELKVVFGNSANGSIELRVNEETWLYRENITTTGDSNNEYANRLYLGGYNTYTSSGKIRWYDDLYVCDGEGSTNNDFLGDCRVVALKTNGQGISTQFTPYGTISNWEAVNSYEPIQAPLDPDTYVNSNIIGSTDFYTVEDISPELITIYGVQTTTICRKDNAGVRGITPLIRTGYNISQESFSISEGFTTSLNGTWQGVYFIQDKTPGGEEWTQETINNIQIGVKVGL